MKKLRSRKFAAVVMVLIIVISLCAGTVTSVYKKFTKTMDSYYNANDGYGDIEGYFTLSSDCAHSLYKLAKNCGVDKGMLDVYYGYIVLTEKSNTPAEKYSAMQKLFLETEVLYTEIKNGDYMDQTDLNTAGRLYFEITGNAQRVNNVTLVRRDSYNEAADKFNEKVLASFPVSIYYKTLSIEKLERIY